MSDDYLVARAAFSERLEKVPLREEGPKQKFKAESTVRLLRDWYSIPAGTVGVVTYAYSQKYYEIDPTNFREYKVKFEGWGEFAWVDEYIIEQADA